VYVHEVYEEAIEVADEQEPVDENATACERSRSAEYDVINSTVKKIETDHGSISLDDLMRLQKARAKWLRIAAELNVCFQGIVSASVTHVNSVTNRSRDDCAEKDWLIQELWNIQDFSLLAIDIPTFKFTMSGPDRDRWMKAYQTELNSDHELDVYELVERPNDQRVIKEKVVCEGKRVN
jgi:hypothetical protein